MIGAFKYAGRRRMAFSVGTTIAQFHRELGLVVEAEELLSDICKFYSEDQWTQLSTNAFALLADCQLKLKMEDKYPWLCGGGGYKCPHSRGVSCTSIYMIASLTTAAKICQYYAIVDVAPPSPW